MSLEQLLQPRHDLFWSEPITQVEQPRGEIGSGRSLLASRVDACEQRLRALQLTPAETIVDRPQCARV